MQSIHARFVGVELYFDDLERAKKFYQETLGLAVSDEQLGHYAKFDSGGNFVCLERKGLNRTPPKTKRCFSLRSPPEIGDCSDRAGSSFSPNPRGPFYMIPRVTICSSWTGLGTNNRTRVSNQVMTRKPLPTKHLFFLGVTAFLLHPAFHVAQQPEGSAALKSFVGTWKGTCADGAEFLVLKLSQSGNEVAGSVSIANMNGANGRCSAVIDPPTEEHAMKIHDAQLREKALAFKGAGQTAFEMSVVGEDEATLKFLGTPVENNPWKLKWTQ
jgi:bleomycin resistance family protein